jgi:rsbT co-antagonist protein RsbR
MPSMTTTHRGFTADEKAAMRTYWAFFEPIAASINHELRELLLRSPDWAPLFRAMTPAQMDAQDLRGRTLQRAAIIDDAWQPYLDDLYAQGEQYARMGVSFFAWYDVIATYRDVIRRRLREVASADVERASTIGDGMNCFIDLAMSHLGDAYLRTKERIIAAQASSLRELSVPVMEVEERLLIAPLVGAIDADRARHLTERLLFAIRDRRAYGVVIDVTGVPVVDSAVANHLVQTVAAARLMGAQVVVTGLSPAIASTLAALGDALPAVACAAELRDGLEDMRRAAAAH